VARLAELAHLDKSVLSYSWLVLRAPGDTEAPVDERSVRVLSESMRNKAGRERLVVCGARGRFSLSTAARPAGWCELGRGDAVRVIAPEERANGWGVAPATRLERLEDLLPR
jgi:hypothetical protein